MFRKKVRVLGRSVPVAFIALAIIVTVALAAFIFSRTITANFAARAGPSYSTGVWSCALTGNGAEVECVGSNGNLAIGFSGLDDDSIINATASINNTTSGGTTCLSLDTSAVDPAVAVSASLNDAGVPIGSLPHSWNSAAGPYAIDVEFTFPTLAAGEVVAEFEIGLDMAEGSCP